MYLSYLLIDTAADPARPRPGRGWVRNPYRVHQRLCMAFPSRSRRECDPHFLAPVEPTDFRPPVPVPVGRDKPCHVHLPRAADTGFLFRVDPLPNRPLDRPAVGPAPAWERLPDRHGVLVQSADEPDWDYAFHNAPEFLAARPLCKPFAPVFEPGQRYSFRLRANPTKRLYRGSPGPDGRPLDPKWIGKRIGLYAEVEQRKWLDRHAAGNGFRVVEVRCDPDGLTCSRKDDHRITFASVRFEGTLEVTDPGRFHTAVAAGIGPGKGFGLGLLSLAPVGG